VHFDENSVGASGDRSACQGLDELRLAADGRARRARKLYAVRRVEHHRPSERAHDQESAHIDDQIVVAEARPALGQDDLSLPVAGLVRRVANIVRRDNCPFLMFITLPVRPALREIGLTT